MGTVRRVGARGARRYAVRTAVIVTAAGVIAVGSCGEPTATSRPALSPIGRRPLTTIRNGGTHADSVRLAPARGPTRAAFVRSGSRILPPIGPAAFDLDPTHTLCGVEEWTLPIGYTLLPGTTEGDFVHAPSPSPVWAAYSAEQPVCGPSMSATPVDYPLYTSAYPVPPERVQLAPVEVRFDTAVTTAGVYGMGAFKCYTGRYGKMTAYDSTGAVIATAEMQMREPGDCGEDSITYGAYGTVSAPSARIKRLKIEAPQPWSWPVWINNVFYGTGYVTADYMLVLSAVPAAPVTTIEIVRAGGPNGGSFIVRDPENVIRLDARVTPADLAPNVEWEVVDAPDDQVYTISPDAVPRGASTSFVVPATNRNEGRWPRAHPGTLSQKSLAYQITAKLTYRGTTIRSVPVLVRQDEIDTIREEYVEFGQERVLALGELRRDGDANRNLTADYALWPSGALLLAKMPIIQQLAMRRFGRSITVISGYRNPVHHFLHLNPPARAVNSPHLYGLATDWDILRASERPAGLNYLQWFNEIHRMTRDPSVDGCWEPEQYLRDHEGGSLTHAHTDWRRPCPDYWLR